MAPVDERCHSAEASELDRREAKDWLLSRLGVTMQHHIDDLAAFRSDARAEGGGEATELRRWLANMYATISDYGKILRIKIPRALAGEPCPNPDLADQTLRSILARAPLTGAGAGQGESGPTGSSPAGEDASERLGADARKIAEVWLDSTGMVGDLARALMAALAERETMARAAKVEALRDAAKAWGGHVWLEQRADAIERDGSSDAIARVEEKGREDLATARAEGADGAFEIAAEQCAREAAIWKDDHTTRGKGIRQGARLCESRIRARASDRLVAVSVDDLRHELKLCKCDRPHGPLDSWPEVHLDAVDRIRVAEMGKR